jgi:hypothetical protein
MWLDFRYWLEPEQPVDLGHATEFVGPQGVPSGHHGRYVVLEGTPDVQNALRGATRERYVGYLRITEGGGQLFAAVPRDKDESVDSRFAGRYAGRMLRLGSAPAYPWLEQYFAAENVVETVDASADALAEALRGASDDGLTVETERGPVHLLPQGRVWLVVRRAVARVQLGAESFRNADQAEAAVAQLGYPYLREAGSPTMPFHRFTVKIPEDARDAAERKLLGMLEQAPDPTDPKEGVSVLPMTATYGVPVDQLRLAGDTLVFPPGDNTSSPGYDVQGDRLVERPTEDKPMELPVSRVHAVRLDDPVTIDPDGYLIVVGAAPSSERIAGLAWLLVLGIALANVGSVAMAVRRRR